MENKGNSLAKISLGINVLLIIAVIILFAKMPSGANADEVVDSNDSTATSPIIPDDGTMKICYFNADSLNSLELMAELETMSAQAQQNAESKMRNKQGEIEKWQAGWGDPSTLLPTEQRKYQEEGLKMQQDIAMFEQQVQMELAMEQENVMRTLITKVSDASKIFAEDNGYDFVLSYQTGQTIYYGSPNFDVTNQLMDLINTRYRANQQSDADADGAEEPAVDGEE